MENSFKEGFEKTAFINMAKTFGSRLLSRHGKKFVSTAKNVGTNLKKDPLKTAKGVGSKALSGGGKVLTVGLVGAEALSAMDKTKADIAKPKGTNMTSNSFHSVKR